MRREFTFALLTLLPVPFAAAQQATQQNPTPPVNTPAGAPIVYYAGPGVAAPELLPPRLTPPYSGHCNKLEGTAILTAAVDTDGTAQDIQPLFQNGNGLDAMALKIVLADRFKPGAHDGVPAPVAVAIEVDLSACQDEKKDPSGKKAFVLHLHSSPTQFLEVRSELPAISTADLQPNSPNPSSGPEPTSGSTGAKMGPQVAVDSGKARSLNDPREVKFSGISIVAVTIDAKGNPQHVYVVKSLSPTLDAKALEAVRRYHFRPAVKDGIIPVPVQITVEVDFRLY